MGRPALTIPAFSLPFAIGRVNACTAINRGAESGDSSRAARPILTPFCTGGREGRAYCPNPPAIDKP